MLLAAGETHRLRFINASVADDADFELRSSRTTDTSLVRWRAIAKDGADLHASRATRGPAKLFITPGETYDFELVLPAGDYVLRMRSTDDASMLLRVR